MRKSRKDRKNNRSAPDELGRLLAAHFGQGEELAPSSGFASSVMEAVKSETGAPSPIAFPWRRALPGIVAVFCAMAGFAVLVFRLSKAAAASGIAPHGTVQTGALTFHLTSLEQALCWTGLAASLSLALAMGSMRLTRRG